MSEPENIRRILPRVIDSITVKYESKKKEDRERKDLNDEDDKTETALCDD